MKAVEAASFGERLSESATVALADHDDDLALAVLVFGQATVNAILGEVRRLDVAAEIAAIDFGNLAFAADDARPSFRTRRPRGFCERERKPSCIDAQIARQRQRRLALDLVAEDDDRREIGAQRELVEGEQRPRREGERASSSACSGSGARRLGARS